jgi:hypothetical protein
LFYEEYHLKKIDETINRKNQKLFVQLEMDDDRELGCDGDTGPKCLVWEMVEQTTTKTPLTTNPILDFPTKQKRQFHLLPRNVSTLDDHFK